MKHYSGRKFERLAATRGITIEMQAAIDHITPPPQDVLDSAMARGAEGVIRKSFFEVESKETTLYIQIEVIFTPGDHQIHEVVEFDDKEQYNFYRSLAATESRGTIQSN